ncbi:Ig-like domain-containing protein [Paenibacillus sp. IHBB 10380]|uniref:Ig-like domain-containing protein n=1 Tax=Paenibacillus sp. IHBB 10380 TaxID=1566358 RepID=UPI0005CFD748|nr:Ig-like domain-containing protein [Paenibacillus sp. IHBB 10380]AJS60485.1 scaffolding protein [Paenibacillus sp. IHBB 10380]
MIQKKAIFNVLVSTSLLTSLVLPSWVSADGSANEVQREQPQGNSIIEGAVENSESRTNAASISQASYSTANDIVSVQPIADSTYPYRTKAFDFELPSHVKVTLSDGSETELYVRWDFNKYNPENIMEQTFTVEGTLRGNSWSAGLPDGINNPQNVKATAEITISAAKQIKSVDPLADIPDVENGTSYYSLGLPDSVGVVLDDDTPATVGVTWSQDDYDMHDQSIHTVELTGRLGDRYGLPVGIDNSNDLKAKVKVSFSEARTIMSLQSVVIKDVLSGTNKTEKALGLPEQVEATLSDNQKVQVPIEWDVEHSAYDSSKLEAQTFEVTGAVKGIPAGLKNPNGATARATVKVAAANHVTHIEDVQVPLVPNGISKTALAFYLPKQADVTLSNGRKDKVDVTWELAESAYDPSNEQQQTVKVMGTLVHLPAGVAAPSEKVTANVTISAMRYVESINHVADITGMANGTNATPEALHLPKQVTVTLSDGTTISVDAQWELHNIGYEKGNAKAQTLKVTGTLINLPLGVIDNNVQAKVNVQVDAKIEPKKNVGVTMSDVSMDKEGRNTTEVLGEYFLPLSGDVTGSNGQPINGPGTALMVLQIHINGEEVRTIDYLGRSLSLNTKLYVGWKNNDVLAEVSNVLKAGLLHHSEGRNYEVITSTSPDGIIIKQKQGTGNSEDNVFSYVLENGKGSAVEGLTWGEQETKTEGRWGMVGQKAKFSVQVKNGASADGDLVVHVSDGTIDKQISVPVVVNDDAAAVARKVRERLVQDYEIANAYSVKADGSTLAFEALEEGSKHVKVSVKTLIDTGSKPDEGSNKPDSGNGNNSGGADSNNNNNGNNSSNGSNSNNNSNNNNSSGAGSAGGNTTTDKDNAGGKGGTPDSDKAEDGDGKPANTFVDLQNHKWAQKSIEFLNSKGIVLGTSEHVFAPNAAMKRGDFALLLMRMFGMKSDATVRFSDVPQSSYYYEAITSLKAQGIVQGFGGDKYDPEAPMTRQDLMVILHKALTKSGIELKAGEASLLNHFSDSDKVKSYAKDAVLALITEGIVKGDGSKLNPTAHASRAEVAVLLEQVFHKIPVNK